MAVSVEPVARYCKQLTAGGMQVLPSVSTSSSINKIGDLKKSSTKAKLTLLVLV